MGYCCFNEVVWRLDFEEMRFPTRAPLLRLSPGSRRHAASYGSDESHSGAGKHQYSTFRCLNWPALERLHLRGARLALESTQLPACSAPRLRRLVLQDSVRAAVRGAMGGA